MSILETTTSGISTNGQRIVVAAQEKMGKTTLCCDAPNVLLVPLEQGFASQTCERTPMLTYWEHVEQLCLELIEAAKAGTFQRGRTIAWDSATALERLIHDHTLRTDPGWAEGNPRGLTMNSVHGGYGKGYHIANEKFVKWMNWMDQLTMYGINIVIAAHVFASDVVDPAYGEYNSWDILLHSPKNNKEYGKRELLTQWADLVGFLHEPIFVTKAKDATIAQGVSQGQGRVLAVTRTPAWVAGNRYGLTESIQIPATDGWNHLAAAIYASKGIDIYKR